MRALLEGIRVVDCTEWIAGAFAATVLADFGADVVHIERPGQGDPLRGTTRIRGQVRTLPSGKGANFEFINRNKRDIVIDLSKPKGREIIYKMVDKADVFVTGMRAKSIAAMKLDYEILSKRNPRLIYASLSPFGTKGPDAGVGCLDPLAQARSGLMSPGGSTPRGAAVGMADHMAGIMLGHGIIAGLLARERYGIGQHVSTSMLASAMAFEEYEIDLAGFLGDPMPAEERERARNPLFNFYYGSDGRALYLGALQGDRYWPVLCKVLERPELEKDPRFDGMAKREDNRESLIAIIDEVFKQKTSSEWAEILKEQDILFAPVQTVGDLFVDPQVVANEMIFEVDHPDVGKAKLLSPPIKLSETPASFRSFAPEWSQHTEEVLLEYDYTWEQILALRDEGVIA